MSDEYDKEGRQEEEEKERKKEGQKDESLFLFIFTRRSLYKTCELQKH